MKYSGTAIFFDFRMFQDVGTTFGGTSDSNCTIFDFRSYVLGKTRIANFVALHVQRLRENNQREGLKTGLAVLARDQ